MSYAQQQIIDMAPQLSETAANAVVHLMHTLIVLEGETKRSAANEKMLAFERLDKIVSGYTPVLDPDKELAEARESKYGTLD